MTSPTGNRASSAFNPSEQGDPFFTLPLARKMLPLVRRIVGEMLQINHSLALLQPELERLDRMRRTLAWPQRARRYQVHEEVQVLEQHFLDAVAELEGLLGVMLVDPERGQVGFPTRVNDRTAFFCWQPGEEEIHHWQYAGEKGRRLIPASWSEAVESEV